MRSKNKWILGIIVFATLIASLGILSLDISAPFRRQASVPDFFKENRDQRAMSRNAWYLERLADPSTGKIPRNIRQKELSFKLKISEGILQKGRFFKIPRFSLPQQTIARPRDANNHALFLAKTKAFPHPSQCSRSFLHALR